MALEIVRKLVGGVWRTVLEDQGSGPGSTPNLAAVLAEGADAGGSAITGLDDPTADQDAATKKYVDENGGSSTVRLLDLGTVEAADVVDGPVTLYTPAAGELVGPVLLRDVVFTDNTSICIGRDEANGLDPETGLPPLAAWDSDLARDGAGFVPEYAIAVVPTTTGPVTAAATGTVGMLPASPWEANTPYVNAATVIGSDGHVWRNEGAGTSGNAEPDFAGNHGGSVVDNDMTWDDVGALPTSGSAHVYAYVGATETP